MATPRTMPAANQRREARMNALMNHSILVYLCLSWAQSRPVDRDAPPASEPATPSGAAINVGANSPPNSHTLSNLPIPIQIRPDPLLKTNDEIVQELLRLTHLGLQNRHPPCEITRALFLAADLALLYQIPE